MKRFILTMLTLPGLLLSIQANSEAQIDAQNFQNKFSGIARYSDGTSQKMHQDEAVLYCSKYGGRLPTARELATLAMSLGAKGLSEIANGKLDQYSVEVNGINPDGVRDNFYYTDTDFKRPAFMIPSDRFLWSSSRVPDEIPNLIGSINLFVTFDTTHFDVSYMDRDQMNAVICLKNR